MNFRLHMVWTLDWNS